MLFARKVVIFYDFPNIRYSYVSSILSLQFTTAAYTCIIHSAKKELIQNKKSHLNGYLAFTGKCTKEWYKELCNYVKLCTITFICFI